VFADARPLADCRNRTNYDTLNARTVKAAAMVNVAGHVVNPDVASFVSAMNDFASQSSQRILLLGRPRFAYYYYYCLLFPFCMHSSR
jgi:hypothetical protein